MGFVRRACKETREDWRLTIALVGLHDLSVIVCVDSAVIGGRSVAFIRGVPPVRQHLGFERNKGQLKGVRRSREM